MFQNFYACHIENYQPQVVKSHKILISIDKIDNTKLERINQAVIRMAKDEKKSAFLPSDPFSRPYLGFCNIK